MPGAAKLEPVTAFDLTATILSGQTASGEIDLQGGTLVGLFMPAAFTGTTITFTAAPAPGGTHVAVQDGTGANVSVTVSASKYVKLDPAVFAGLRWVKLVSGSAEGADRAITLAARAV